MTQTWRPTPHFKIETNSQTFIDEEAWTLQVVRPENNVSFLVLSVDDYKSKNFETVFDKFNTIDVSLRYGSDSWEKVFSGVITTVAPKLSVNGEILECSAWGKGNALVKTHCSTSYGKESKNTTKDTPKEIWDDLVDNYINKRLGTASTTGYAITKTKIADIQNGLTITHLNSPFLNNFTMVNRVCDIVSAYVGEGVASCHWFVDTETNPNLFINTIGSHENNASGWPTYWKSSQAASTIEVAKDMLLYDFQKYNEDYANIVLLCSAFRKPGYDYWTENQSSLWGHTAVQIGLSDVASPVIVGGHSLAARCPPAGGGNGFFWYPSAKNAAWDLTKCGSEHTIPTINFYARRNDTLQSFGISLCTNNNDKFNLTRNLVTDLASADQWYHFSFPVGPYYDRKEDVTDFKWTIANSPDWADINFIEFPLQTTANTRYIYLDDLHFAGKIIRQADDSGDAALYDDYQVMLRNDMAVDDTLKESDDSGTAARLAYAELLRRNKKPIVGVIQIPGAVDILAGQLIHIHACKQAGGAGFRIDKDMRVKELKHVFAAPPTGFRTILNLTDDVHNAHVVGAPTRHSVLAEYVGALGHAEARDLKSSGIDNLIPPLVKAY